ncbi:MAG TPA: PCRF domain-containing protein, partial [Herpetosiphonaceae bacterium]
RALVRVTALGRDAEGWVGQLIGMYRAWAARKGYEEQSFDPRHGLGAAYELRPGGSFLALYVQGSNVYEFLRHEAGIHRLNLGEAESRQRHLARVSVILVPDEAEAGDPEQLRGLLAGLATASSDEDSAVARVYHQGRYRFVRDPRTGERATNVAAVLGQGEIDAFLLASLRQLVSEPAVA